MGVYGSRQIEFRFDPKEGGLFVHLGGASSMYVPRHVLRKLPTIEIAAYGNVILSVGISAVGFVMSEMSEDTATYFLTQEKYEEGPLFDHREFTQKASTNLFTWLRYTMVEGRHPIIAAVL